jgi:hypothetical protein
VSSLSDERFRRGSRVPVGAAGSSHIVRGRPASPAAYPSLDFSNNFLCPKASSGSGTGGSGTG